MNVIDVTFLFVLNAVVNESVFSYEVCIDGWRNIIIWILLIKFLFHSIYIKSLNLLLILKFRIHILNIRFVRELKEQSFTFVLVKFLLLHCRKQVVLMISVVIMQMKNCIVVLFECYWNFSSNWRYSL
jgi:hypothetical protein